MSQTSADRRVGLPGGTFDPPHIGHIGLARAALAQLELDELIWIPAAKNPLKTRRPADSRIRLEMVRAAIAGEPRMSVSDIELSRPGPSYLIDTLNELTFVNPAQYWFITGIDSLKTFPNWKAPAKVVKLCRIATAKRPGSDVDDLDPILEGHIDWIEMEAMDVSSSEIRNRIFERKPVAQYLQPEVYSIILRHKLYETA